MKTSLTRFFILVATALAAVTANAEDIDIYNATNGNVRTNLLIVVDTSAATSATFSGGTTYFDAQKNALVNVLDKFIAGTVDGSKLNIGMMLFSDGNLSGAYVRFGLRPMTSGNAQILKTMVSGLSLATDKPSAAQNYGIVMMETYRYLSGKKANSGGPAGSNSVNKMRDYAGSAVQKSAAAYGAGETHAFANDSTFQYQLPAVGDVCDTRNFILVLSANDPSTDPVGQGVSCSAQPEADPQSNARRGIACEKGVDDENTVPYVSKASNLLEKSWADEWARFIYGDASSVIKGTRTYGAAVYNPSGPASQYSGRVALLSSMASSGGGKYFDATDPQKLVNAVAYVVNEALSQNSIFVSASLPVSVNTQGTYLNQVYMGVFRPGTTGPRWFGNLKRYQFGYISNSTDIQLQDAVGLPAAGSNGFISASATSFWTHNDADGGKNVYTDTGSPQNQCLYGGATTTRNFWCNDQYANSTHLIQTDAGAGNESGGGSDDKPDGPVVEKGGAAQQIRDSWIDRDRTAAADAATKNQSAARTIYTLPVAASNWSCNTSTLAVTGFGGNATAGTLSAQFNLTGFSNLSTTNTQHQCLFGTSTESDLKNLIAWARGADNAGDEQGPTWGTDPATFSPQITVRPSVHGDVLHSRPVAIAYDPNDTTASSTYVFYGGNDGMLHAVSGQTGKEIWAFMAPEYWPKLKRLRDNSPPILWGNASSPGNATYRDYAFDGTVTAYQNGGQRCIFVSMRRGADSLYAFDVSNIDTPKFLWRRSSSDAGWSAMGQTWSTPKVVYDPATGLPKLVFGAGYNTLADTPVRSGMTAGQGKGVFIVPMDSGCNAGSPTVVATDSYVPSEVAVLSTGEAFYYYVGDLDGNVYRIKDEGAGSTARKIASFPGKKFFYPPDLVYGIKVSGDSTPYTAVLMGSGDRENPRGTGSSDFFFMMRDNLAVSSPATRSTADVCGSGPSRDTGTCTADATGQVGSNCLVPSTGDHGWCLAMESSEKVVNAATSIGGIVYFGSNKPVDNACGSLGLARAYSLNFITGEAAAGKNSFTQLIGGGLPPSPVAGTVLMPDGKQVPFIIGSGKGGSSVEAEKPKLDIKSTRHRTYWYKKTTGDK